MALRAVQLVFDVPQHRVVPVLVDEGQRRLGAPLHDLKRPHPEGRVDISHHVRANTAADILGRSLSTTERCAHDRWASLSATDLEGIRAFGLGDSGGDGFIDARASN